MTIIAVDRVRGVMLADTLLSAEDHVIGYTTKIFRGSDGSLYGSAGDNIPCCAFNQWMKEGGQGVCPAEIFKSGTCEGLVLTTDRRILRFEGIMGDEMHGDTSSVGIGTYAFNAAVAAGADIYKAVDVACQQTLACGGAITELKLETYPHAARKQRRS